MKFKNLFISLGLVLAVGAGVGTALSVKDNVKEAEATAAVPTKLYTLVWIRIGSKAN